MEVRCRSELAPYAQIKIYFLMRISVHMGPINLLFLTELTSGRQLGDSHSDFDLSAIVLLT